jgi:hypothetical protein
MNPTLVQLCRTIVSQPELHCKWLNTLSLMENTGARKISASEDSTTVDLTTLKHAAEEFRHAFYLKKLIGRLDETACPNYSPAYLLAPQASRHYLHELDVAVCRMLKLRGMNDRERIKTGAYLLVTYAIEVRADELYGAYQCALDEVSSRVNVKSIIAEEEGHLEEMQHLLVGYAQDWSALAKSACEIECTLFDRWVHQLQAEVEAWSKQQIALQ